MSDLYACGYCGQDQPCNCPGSMTISELEGQVEDYAGLYEKAKTELEALKRERDELKLERDMFKKDTLAGYGRNLAKSELIVELEDELDTLKAEVQRLREALEWFCHRVEAGEVRSKRTYARFKEILSTLQKAPERDENSQKGLATAIERIQESIDLLEDAGNDLVARHLRKALEALQKGDTHE